MGEARGSRGTPGQGWPVPGLVCRPPLPQPLPRVTAPWVMPSSPRPCNQQELAPHREITGFQSRFKWGSVSGKPGSRRTAASHPSDQGQMSDFLGTPWLAQLRGHRWASPRLAFFSLSPEQSEMAGFRRKGKMALTRPGVCHLGCQSGQGWGRHGPMEIPEVRLCCLEPPAPSL